MYCPNCGQQNPDSSKFCQNCGSPLSAPAESSAAEQPAPAPAAQEFTAPPAQTYAAPAQTYAAPPTQNYAQQNYAPGYGGSTYPQGYAPEYAPGYAYAQPNYQASGVLQAVRDFVRSPLVLVTIILMSVQIVFTIIASFLSAPSLTNMIAKAAGSGAYGALDGLQSVQTSFSIPIGSILIVIGLWMAYAAARKADDGPISTAGLTMIKVITIIELVSISVIAFFGLLILLALSFGANFINLADLFDEVPYELRGLASGIFTGIAIGFIIALVFVIVFMARVLSSIAAAKKTFSTGEPVVKGVSVFVAVILFIGAASLFFSSFAMFLAPLLMIAMLIGSATLIMTGIVLLKYRELMKSFAA